MDPNRAKVLDGTATPNTVSQVSYTPNLTLGTTYYWRVDEVIGSDTWRNNIAKDIWSFSTPAFRIVETSRNTPPMVLM